MAEAEQQTGPNNQLTEAAPAPETADTSPISWTASEFIKHDKSSSWYLGLAIVAIIGSVLMYLLTHDFVSVAVILVAALLFAVYGSHQPRQLEYHLDTRGLTIGNKSYVLSQFRSFTVVPEGVFSSIIFMPLKRFMPPLTIYYPPEDEQHILALLTSQLPFEEPRRDMVDSLMRKVRF